MHIKKRLYQIYTEDKNRQAIEEITSLEFEGFSVIAVDGFYKGTKEKAVIIEIIGELSIHASADDLRFELERARRTAQQIKTFNQQEVVLLTFSDIRVEEV